MVRHEPNLIERLGTRDPIFHFLLEKKIRERERREREHSRFSLRSSEFRWSEFVEPIVKVHLLDEFYVYIPKMRDFVEDSKEEILENQIFWD